MDIKGRVIKIIKDQMCMNAVSSTDSLAGDVLMDSFDRCELAIALELGFDGLLITDDEIASAETVGDVVCIVEKKTAVRNASGTGSRIGRRSFQGATASDRQWRN